jgi:hypothetical protein
MYIVTGMIIIEIGIIGIITIETIRTITIGTIGTIETKQLFISSGGHEPFLRPRNALLSGLVLN